MENWKVMDRGSEIMTLQSPDLPRQMKYPVRKLSSKRNTVSCINRYCTDFWVGDHKKFLILQQFFLLCIDSKKAISLCWRKYSEVLNKLRKHFLISNFKSNYRLYYLPSFELLLAEVDSIQKVSACSAKMWVSILRLIINYRAWNSN